MNRIIFILLVLVFPLFGEGPHLILNFDINSTLIASDKIKNETQEDVLNELLAKKYVARWDNSINEEISFYKYVKENQNELNVHHFLDYLEKNNHPLYNQVSQEYEFSLYCLQNSPGNIFNSFYTLLKYLDENQISYSIFLRSFGSDIPDVMNELREHYKLTFKTAEFKEYVLYIEGEDPLINPYEIYNKLRRMPHIAIHDDWEYWNNYGKFATYGKPFYVNGEDLETINLFFDDNIRENDLKNIIGPVDVLNNKSIPISQLIKSGKIIKVDSLKAIQDQEYYIKIVKAKINN